VPHRGPGAPPSAPIAVVVLGLLGASVSLNDPSDGNAPSVHPVAIDTP
jgi:hypothetical protein